LTAAVEARSRRAQLTLYLAVLLSVAAVMTTLSRGGLVALGILVLAVVLLPARALFRSPRQKAVMLAALLACTAIAFSATSSVFAPRLHQIFTQSGQTGSGRLNLWSAALTSIHERPVLGLGFGAFPGSSIELLNRTPGVDYVNWQPPPNGDFAHSAYLETLAELGLPGLILFAGVLLSTGAHLVRCGRRARRAGNAFLARASNALVLSLVAWAASAIFLSEETARPLWVVIGLSLAVGGLAPSASEAASRRKRRASGLSQSGSRP
jgi:putative inorganic carbon (HCO3(-)) transporter